MKKFFEEFKEFASSFLSDVVNFIFMAFVLFCLLKAINKLTSCSRSKFVSKILIFFVKSFFANIYQFKHKNRGFHFPCFVIYFDIISQIYDGYFPHLFNTSIFYFLKNLEFYMCNL